eukprot:838559-Amphidinium_carterae.1
MLRINQQTTFDEVHQWPLWISNYFNSTYTGTEDDKRGSEDVKFVVGLLNKKGKSRKGKNKGKAPTPDPNAY